MDSLQIFILAVVQGLTEFLPISSSAHLVLLPQLIGWADQGLVFDVAVHFGSLIAVLFYFRLEVRRMLISWTRSVAGGAADQDSLLAWWVIIGTLPAIIVGFLLQGPIEDKLREPWVIAIASIGFFYVLTMFMGYGSMVNGGMKPADNNMAAPLLAGTFSEWFLAIISAIAFATILGTVSGLIVASSGSKVIFHSSGSPGWTCKCPLSI